MDVGLRDLELFMTLTEERHFTRAAALKGISQPFLSRAVARLERALGTRLVERTTRRVALTPAGERLGAELASILPQLEAAIRSVKEPDVLRLGFTWLLPSTLARDLIDRLGEATGAQVQLVRRDDRWGGVADGRTDAAIVTICAGTTLLAMIGTKKTAPARRTLRLKSLSPAQPPHGPTVGQTQTCSRSARRVTRRAKRGAELAVWVFLPGELLWHRRCANSSPRALNNCCYLLRHAAGDSRTAATEGRWLIRIIVSPGMDDNRMAFDI